MSHEDRWPSGLEADLVGAALFGAAWRLGEVLDVVRDDDFDDEVCRATWGAIREAHNTNDGDASFITDIPVALRARLGDRAPGVRWIEALSHIPPDTDPMPFARMVVRAACDRAVEEIATSPGRGAASILEAASAIADVRKRLDGLGDTIPVSSEDAASLLDDDAEPPPEELVERLITRPGVCIVYGASGSGKSYAIMAALLDLVGGGGAFCGADGLQIRPRLEKFGEEPDRVLWVYGSEDPRRRIRTRIRELWDSGPHAEKPFPASRFLVASPGPRCLATAEGLAWLRREIGAARASVVVLDTVQSLTSANLDGSDGGEVSRWMAEMHRIRDRFGAVVIPVCHTSKTPSDAKSVRGKADALLGSQAWRALADGLVMLDAPDGDASQGTLRIVKGKDVEDPIPPLKIGMEASTKRFRPLDEDESGETVPLASAARPDARVGRPRAVTAADVLALRSAHPDGLAWSTAHEALGVGRSTWHRARGDIQRELLAAGHALVEGTLRWAPETVSRNCPEMVSRNGISGHQGAPSRNPPPTPLRGGGVGRVSGQAWDPVAAARLNESFGTAADEGPQKAATDPAGFIASPWDEHIRRRGELA